MKPNEKIQFIEPKVLSKENGQSPPFEQKLSHAYLVLLSDGKADSNRQGRRFLLTGEDMLIGSAPEVPVRIQGEGVESKHAVLCFINSHWHIKNLTSRLNLFVNGTLSTHHIFRQDGEVFRIGTNEFKLFTGNTQDSDYAQELYHKSITDTLTGAHNRRFFEQRLCEELEHCLDNKSVALVFMDLDHFHNLNTTYTHPGGDAVLREVTRRIQTQLRKDDLLCRWGGEEFAVLLPRTTHAQALDIAERIRLLIAKTPVAFNEISIPVTLSAGVAATQNIMGIESFVKEADQKLYVAKANGRNQVQG